MGILNKQKHITSCEYIDPTHLYSQSEAMESFLHSLLVQKTPLYSYTDDFPEPLGPANIRKRFPILISAQPLYELL